MFQLCIRVKKHSPLQMRPGFQSHDSENLAAATLATVRRVRRQVAFDLYALCGIARTDMPGRTRAMLRKFEFLGASVGLFISRDRDMALGSWLNCAEKYPRHRTRAG